MKNGDNNITDFKSSVKIDDFIETNIYKWYSGTPDVKRMYESFYLTD